LVFYPEKIGGYDSQFDDCLAYLNQMGWKKPPTSVMFKEGRIQTNLEVFFLVDSNCLQWFLRLMFGAGGFDDAVFWHPQDATGNVKVQFTWMSQEVRKWFVSGLRLQPTYKWGILGL